MSGAAERLFRRMKWHEVNKARLLQIPQDKLEKPLLIESAHLGDRLYLVADETQTREIEGRGGVCYLPEEIETLLARSKGMGEESLRDYLSKVHRVKRTFMGAKIQ